MLLFCFANSLSPLSLQISDLHLAILPRISPSPGKAKQSQQALTPLFTWGGPGYCFPPTHPPPLWTHTNSECAEKFHAKNFQIQFRKTIFTSIERLKKFSLHQNLNSKDFTFFIRRCWILFCSLL